MAPANSPPSTSCTSRSVTVHVAQDLPSGVAPSTNTSIGGRLYRINVVQNPRYDRSVHGWRTSTAVSGATEQPAQSDEQVEKIKERHDQITSPTVRSFLAGAQSATKENEENGGGDWAKTSFNGIVLAGEVSDYLPAKRESMPAKRKYPEALIQEYHALTAKDLDDRLTRKETLRLAQLKAQINSIDRADPDSIEAKQKLKGLHHEVKDIRRNLEDAIATARSQRKSAT